MRSYSLFSIVLLCLAILGIDISAFYWLLSITRPIESEILKNLIYILFWVFTIGLITSILLLKIKLEIVAPERQQLIISKLYGLTVSSFIPKLIFVIVISLLYYSNFMFSQEASLIVIPVIGLLSGFLPFFIILYAIFSAVYRFKVHHINLKLETLPQQFNGIRIVHISDLHLGSFNYKYHILERAIKKINELNPDLIVFTGDLVNNFSWELRGWHTVLKKLKAKDGKFAVLGNHDYGDYSQWATPEEKRRNFNEIQEFYIKTDFTLLRNEAKLLEKANTSLAIIGVENWGNPEFKKYGDLQKAMKNVDGANFKILLSHDPTHWSEEVAHHTSIDLTLSGHTHGMQAGINFRTKKWSPIKYKYKHWAGLYKENNQYLYVTRGLGWMGFPGRLGMRPEITLIELYKK
ncbi:metallophosphoesterase [Maribacter confluentis]|uniref:Metallophosphoesterase n=1 Tax=Maribacter confluentis TaxID=1656093 RepID=A0ABT8RT51_9FLAO|nr:metallophosphoesterase [Maribacter confluentis]MDO1513895.1 metallophosphoesterase [Maribacter confluentis]